MTDIKDKKEQPEIIERTPIQSESPAHLEQEKEKNVVETEKARDERIISAELRREIEMMQLDENTKKDAEAKAEKIGFLGEEEKIEHLLKIAREKGLIYAIHVARKMNEPYLLDVLHDTLAKEGFYQDFVK